MGSIDAQGFAQNGFDEISGQKTGEWVAIQTDGGPATFSAETKSGDNLTSRARAEGIIVFGDFKAIDVSSGNVLAVKRIPRG